MRIVKIVRINKKFPKATASSCPLNPLCKGQISEYEPCSVSCLCVSWSVLELVWKGSSSKTFLTHSKCCIEHHHYSKTIKHLKENSVPLHSTSAVEENDSAKQHTLTNNMSLFKLPKQNSILHELFQIEGRWCLTAGRFWGNRMRPFYVEISCSLPWWLRLSPTV